VSYLTRLQGEQRDKAEDDIRKTPRQIATPYRNAIEAELVWTPVSDS